MIFENEQVGLEEVGAMKVFSSKEIAESPVSIGFECLDREMFDAERCYEPLGVTGVKWARCQTGWNRCETQKGVYNFQWLDSVVDNLLQRGITPWFNVGYGNKLYMPDASHDAAVGYVPLYYGEETLQAWKNYVGALARHFKGRVGYFEIWNEPNGDNFWQPRTPDPLEYAKLIRLTAEVIRQEIPDAKVGGCVSGTHYGYLLQLFRSEIVGELNFFCLHAYCVQPELNYTQAVAHLRRILNACGGSHVELWQGESGFASWFPEHHWLPPYVLESEHNQAVWMLRRYFTDFALGMKRSSFFQVADMMGKDYCMANVTKKNPARHGILNGITYTPKQSFYAIQRLAAFFQGGMAAAELYCTADLNGIFPRTERHSRLIDIAVQTNTYQREGHPFFEYHLAEDMQYGFKGLAPVTITVENNPDLKNIEKPILLDMLTGKIHRILTWDAGDRYGVSIFRNLPLTDYPLVICDETALPWIPQAK